MEGRKLLGPFDLPVLGDSTKYFLTCATILLPLFPLHPPPCFSVIAHYILMFPLELWQILLLVSVARSQVLLCLVVYFPNTALNLELERWFGS